MVSLGWYIKVKRGIRLIEPSDNKAADYMQRAEDDLKTMEKTEGYWQIISAYYSCYDALYSLLMKIGIKSEIHDCTISLMELLEFEKEEIELMKKLKDDRIDAQYYLKNVQLSDKVKVKSFVLKAKEKASNIDSDAIKTIREKLKKMTE